MFYLKQMAQMLDQKHDIGWALRIGTLAMMARMYAMLTGVCIMCIVLVMWAEITRIIRSAMCTAHLMASAQ